MALLHKNANVGGALAAVTLKNMTVVISSLSFSQQPGYRERTSKEWRRNWSKLLSEWRSSDSSSFALQEGWWLLLLRRQPRGRKYQTNEEHRVLQLALRATSVSAALAIVFAAVGESSFSLLNGIAHRKMSIYLAAMNRSRRQRRK